MTESQSKTNTVLLWPGCLRLYRDYKTPEICIVAGTGYGKTTFGTAFTFDRSTVNNKCRYSIVTSNTYGRLREVNVPMFQDFLQEAGFRDRPPFPDYTINWTYLDLKYRWGHTTLFRSAEKTSVRKLVAITASHAWMDEPGTCDITASIEVTKRVRDPKAIALQRLYTGTPEGVSGIGAWFAQKFDGPDYEIDGHFKRRDGSDGDYWRAPGRLKIHASTRDNPTLPAQYLEDMIREFAWNDNLVLAYIEGQFVPIYDFRGYDFDRTKHSKQVPIHKDRPIWLCWDFNVSVGKVGGVAWCTLQEDGADLHCAAENKGTSRTTDEAVQNFIKQFPVGQYRTREINVVGDANGWSRNVNWYGNSYQIIKQELAKAGYLNFHIKAKRYNPDIELRIASVNRMFADQYEKTLYINPKCSRVINSLIQTTIDDKGKIVKPSGQTHTDFSDAIGYGVVGLRPLKQPWTDANYDFSYA